MDLIERTQGSTVTLGYPVYDAHGNDVATLSRSGSTYAIRDRRSYDAWGVMRSQQSAGDPTLRYCASLGHKQDDETGLVYMRARYYEPTSGRFVSEDPHMQSVNWFAYCGNDPVNRSDSSGRAFDDFPQNPGDMLKVLAGVLWWANNATNAGCDNPELKARIIATISRQIARVRRLSGFADAMNNIDQAAAQGIGEESASKGEIGAEAGPEEMAAESGAGATWAAAKARALLLIDQLEDFKETLEYPD